MKLILKSFLISLGAFIAVNLIFNIIGFAISVNLGLLLQDPFLIVALFFNGITKNIYLSIQSIFDNSFILLSAIESGDNIFPHIGNLYMGIGYLLAPIIAGSLAGYFSETKLEALGAFLLVLIVCWLVWTIFYLLAAFGINTGGAAAEYETVANSIASDFSGENLTSVNAVEGVIFMVIATLITVGSFSAIPLIVKKEYAY